MSLQLFNVSSAYTLHIFPCAVKWMESLESFWCGAMGFTSLSWHQSHAFSQCFQVMVHPSNSRSRLCFWSRPLLQTAFLIFFSMCEGSSIIVTCLAGFARFLAARNMLTSWILVLVSHVGEGWKGYYQKVFNQGTSFKVKLYLRDKYEIRSRYEALANAGGKLVGIVEICVKLVEWHIAK